MAAGKGRLTLPREGRKTERRCSRTAGSADAVLPFCCCVVCEVGGGATECQAPEAASEITSKGTEAALRLQKDASG